MEAPFYNSIEPYRRMMKRQKNSFLTPLDVRVMPSGKRFMLLNQFTYHWRDLNITVKRGFQTDFASIPPIFHSLISKLGRYNKAAVIHDAIYQGKYECKLGYLYYTFGRADADRIFLDGMTDLGVAQWKRALMYYAVRIGGWLSWRKR